MRFALSKLTSKHQNVLVKDPHPQSLAALVLLVSSYHYEMKKEWFEFRKKLLKDQLRVWWKPWTWHKKSTLTCVYCKKTHLKEEIEDMRDKSQLKTLATIDHIHPLSKGGKMFDPKNCCIACYNCNTKKKDKLI